MLYSAEELARVRNPVLLITAVTWMLILVAPHSMVALSLGHGHGAGAMAMSPSLQIPQAIGAPVSLAASWVLMLVAMMSPALISPVLYVRMRSFAHRRARSISLFVAGYAAIWMAAGGVLVAIALAANAFAPRSYLPAAGAALIALAWQCSPIKQRCLNRCHAHANLAAFGASADFDVLRFGTTHGVWCALSCWALMLFPMLLPSGHVVAMAIVTVLILGERIEQPMPPAWRWRGLGRMRRALVAQARMRLQALRLER